MQYPKNRALLKRLPIAFAYATLTGTCPNAVLLTKNCFGGHEYLPCPPVNMLASDTAPHWHEPCKRKLYTCHISTLRLRQSTVVFLVCYRAKRACYPLHMVCNVLKFRAGPVMCSFSKTVVDVPNIKFWPIIYLPIFDEYNKKNPIKSKIQQKKTP